eukprot:gb/GECG01012673.1/.p1 GENE.gb/GECG01012673.1/~~gb/GECG01012673.1/.p1  ORF type:complete len:407 (+),score=55.51 gb/GECG01012673.1/:1-1221(+)
MSDIVQGNPLAHVKGGESKSRQHKNGSRMTSGTDTMSVETKNPLHSHKEQTEQNVNCLQSSTPRSTGSTSNGRVEKTNPVHDAPQNEEQKATTPRSRMGTTDSSQLPVQGDEQPTTTTEKSRSFPTDNESVKTNSFPPDDEFTEKGEKHPRTSSQPSTNAESPSSTGTRKAGPRDSQLRYHALEVRAPSAFPAARGYIHEEFEREKDWRSGKPLGSSYDKMIDDTIFRILRVLLLSSLWLITLVGLTSSKLALFALGDNYHRILFHEDLAVKREGDELCKLRAASQWALVGPAILQLIFASVMWRCTQSPHREEKRKQRETHEWAVAHVREEQINTQALWCDSFRWRFGGIRKCILATLDITPGELALGFIGYDVDPLFLQRNGCYISPLCFKETQIVEDTQILGK